MRREGVIFRRKRGKKGLESEIGSFIQYVFKELPLLLGTQP